MIGGCGRTSGERTSGGRIGGSGRSSGERTSGGRTNGGGRTSDGGANGGDYSLSSGERLENERR